MKKGISEILLGLDIQWATLVPGQLVSEVISFFLTGVFWGLNTSLNDES